MSILPDSLMNLEQRSGRRCFVCLYYLGRQLLRLFIWHPIQLLLSPSVYAAAQFRRAGLQYEASLLPSSGKLFQFCVKQNFGGEGYICTDQLASFGTGFYSACGFTTSKNVVMKKVLTSKNHNEKQKQNHLQQPIAAQPKFLQLSFLSLRDTDHFSILYARGWKPKTIHKT